LSPYKVVSERAILAKKKREDGEREGKKGTVT